MNARYRTTSAEDTAAFAHALADLVVGGELMLLVGELGSGKTTFVKGFGAALSVHEPITSPTFTLAQRYRGRLVVNHLDAYRIVDLAEVDDLGLSELVDEDAITLVEWGDVIAAALPRDHLEVQIAHDDQNDDHRIWWFRCVGPRWSARAGAIERALDGWRIES